MLRARDVLGPGSALAASLPGYRPREAQLRMADAVEDALASERPLFVEAGTGTGKTLAYLVPAVLSGKKVVVSTATRALQEQIFEKDLPLLERALAGHGKPFRAAIMKGLTNYLCKRRLFEVSSAGGLAWSDPRAGDIAAWAASSLSGDRAEIAGLPEDARAWLDVQSSSETRIGAACRFYEECFVTRMREEAERATLLVVNHHLFLADLALRARKTEGYASAIPAYDAVIFDEAHRVEDIATDFFGVRFSAARVDALGRDAQRTFGAQGGTGGERVATLAAEMTAAARALFSALGRAGAGTAGGSRRVLATSDWTGEAREARATLELALEALAGAAESEARGAQREALFQVARRAREARADLRFVAGRARREGAEDAGEEPAPVVAWLDPGPARGQGSHEGRAALGASPVDLGGVLRDALFDRVPSVVCTSATLAAPSAHVQSCSFAMSRLGAPPETEELVLPSPFAFESRAALYLPRDLPEPKDPGFDRAAADRIVELVGVTGGGAFVLCTSNRSMARIHEAIRGRLRRAPLLQGEAPKHVLLERFKSARDAVLVATMSFWEGVDVPGHELRLVVIDKIPFAVPTDPVVAARCAALDRAGGSSFAEYSVPAAAITLKQGFGRLIRTETDVGIVAILDRRMTSRPYGRSLVASLPPARRLSALQEVKGFWEEVRPAASDVRPDVAQASAAPPIQLELMPSQARR